MGWTKFDVLLIAGACFFWSCGRGAGESVDTEGLARAAHCAGLDEARCAASSCQPVYADAASGDASRFAGCVSLGCANVLCASGTVCVEGTAGPVCVAGCSDPAACWCAAADGTAQPPGTTFPSPDGCNTCSCDASGQVVCTEIACPPPCSDAAGCGCPLDFVCADGSAPSGPSCECPAACNDPAGCACPLDFVCADGTIPSGPSCECPAACNDPAGCACPLDFVCADGTIPSGPNCECPSTCNDPAGCACPLDFICPDGSTPSGPNCECPPSCTDAAGQPCSCTTADGTTVPIGTTTTDGCNTCVCTSDGSFACTELACPNGG